MTVAADLGPAGSAGDRREQIRTVVSQYFELLEAGDVDRISDLFSPEGEFVPIAPSAPPLGQSPVRGRGAVRAYYRDRVAGLEMTIVDPKYVIDPPHCSVEFESRIVGVEEAVLAVDVFTFDEAGMIARMAAYRRWTA